MPAQSIRVLPKVHTPPNGSSVRTLSRYAAVTVPDVAARWQKTPTRHLGTHFHVKGINFLLLPWPLQVRGSDFRPVAGPLQKLADDSFGFFEFAPAGPLDLDLVDRMLIAARDEAETVDVVVLPESAAEHGEIDDLEALLSRHGVTGLITGVRERPEQPGAFPRNWVHIGVSVGGQWVHISQSKHHRWSLDDGQIRQYHLSGALHPHVRWWEAAEVPRRSVQFVELGDGVTLASLVCEDLAQTDDVANVIRSVGPMIVVTPLLDGPQLGSRWAARYASVLADDPGCGRPDADVLRHGAPLPAARLRPFARGRAVEGPRPGHSRDPAQARRPGHPPVGKCRSYGQAQLRRPPTPRQRQRIRQREHPPDPGLEYRLGAPGFACLLVIPGRAIPGRAGSR